MFAVKVPAVMTVVLLVVVPSMMGPWAIMPVGLPIIERIPIRIPIMAIRIILVGLPRGAFPSFVIRRNLVFIYVFNTIRVISALVWNTPAAKHCSAT
jgi:hypothetical protein